MSWEVNGELVPASGGDPIPLIRHKITVGRRATCDVCLRFPDVSGTHCELAFRDGYWYIRDLGSKSGTKINGARVEQKLLHPGDDIAIAKQRFTIKYNMRGSTGWEGVAEED